MMKSEQRQNEIGIRHRDATAFINARHGASSKGPGPNDIIDRGLNSDGAKSAPPRQRRRRKGQKMRVVDSEGGEAKYRKKRKRRRKRESNAQLRSRIRLGAVCIVSLALGFSLMRRASNNKPRWGPQLRRPGSDAAAPLWKPRARTSPGITPDERDGSKTKGEQPGFMISWVKKLRDAALWQIGQKHQPQTVTLEGWHFPANKNGPIKDLDSDYGGITHHSVRSGSIYARIISRDFKRGVASGAFDPDPDSYETDGEEEGGKTPGSYPNIDSRGRRVLRDASYEQLRIYYDDDWVEVESKANDGVTEEPRACLNAEFSLLYSPTCNDFHERDLGRPWDDPGRTMQTRPRPENELRVKLLDSGYYRNVWVLEDGPWIWPSRYPREKLQDPETYGVYNEERAAELARKAYRSGALKTMKMEHDYSDGQFEQMWLEAIVMDRMTRSPRIMDIYGHCGFATLVEVVPIEFEEVMVPGSGKMSQKKYDRRNADGVHPRNDFAPEEKLDYALQMAESLADLHGYEEGVIVHDDVQPCQWLRTAGGRLKLGDFNRATIMQWDAVGEEYCWFNNGYPFSYYRAPEEFAARNLNEQIDVFSFGNNVYGILTGLWNFYDYDDDGVVHKKLIGGELPWIDPRYRERSFAERKLVELIERCWMYDPNERMSIFDAVDFLRKAIDENEGRNKK